MRVNLIRKPQTSRHKITRTTKNTQINQEELLVARNKK